MVRAGLQYFSQYSVWSCCLVWVYGLQDSSHLMFLQLKLVGAQGLGGQRRTEEEEEEEQEQEQGGVFELQNG